MFLQRMKCSFIVKHINYIWATLTLRSVQNGAWEHLQLQGGDLHKYTWSMDLVRCRSWISFWETKDRQQQWGNSTSCFYHICSGWATHAAILQFLAWTWLPVYLMSQRTSLLEKSDSWTSWDGFTVTWETPEMLPLSAAFWGGCSRRLLKCPPWACSFQAARRWCRSTGSQCWRDTCHSSRDWAPGVR